MTALDHASTMATAPLPVVAAPEPPRSALRRFVGGVRAWMVVPPVDAALLASPALWMPAQARAHVATALLGLVLLTGGTRYRARLHLSVLDELPVARRSRFAHRRRRRGDRDGPAPRAGGGRRLPRRRDDGRLLCRRGSRRHRTTGGRRSQESASASTERSSWAAVASPRSWRRSSGRAPRYGLSVVGFVDGGDRVRSRGRHVRTSGGLPISTGPSDMVRSTCFSSPTATSPSATCSTSSERPSPNAATCWWCPGCTTSPCRPVSATTSARSRSADPHRPAAGTGTSGQAGLRRRRSRDRPRTPLAGDRRLLTRGARRGWPRGDLPAAASRSGRCRVRVSEAAVDAPGDGGRLGDDLVHRRRWPRRSRGPVSAADIPGRAAAAVEHPAGRHDVGGPASRTAPLRRPVLVPSTTTTPTDIASRPGSPAWRR